MSRGRQKVSFEDLLQENVLGTFTVIRGFADLRAGCFLFDVNAKIKAILGEKEVTIKENDHVTSRNA
jgi:hypothetical protein